MTTNNNTTYLPLAALVSTLILTAGMVYSFQSLRANTAFTDKSIAVQGCFETAKGFKATSGDSQTSTWTVQDATVNYEVVKECLAQKGY